MCPAQIDTVPDLMAVTSVHPPTNVSRSNHTPSGNDLTMVTEPLARWSVWDNPSDLERKTRRVTVALRRRASVIRPRATSASNCVTSHFAAVKLSWLRSRISLSSTWLLCAELKRSSPEEAGVLS